MANKTPEKETQTEAPKQTQAPAPTSPWAEGGDKTLTQTNQAAPNPLVTDTPVTEPPKVEADKANTASGEAKVDSKAAVAVVASVPAGIADPEEFRVPRKDEKPYESTALTREPSPLGEVPRIHPRAGKARWGQEDPTDLLKEARELDAIVKKNEAKGK